MACTGWTGGEGPRAASICPQSGGVCTLHHIAGHVKGHTCTRTHCTSHRRALICQGTSLSVYIRLLLPSPCIHHVYFLSFSFSLSKNARARACVRA